MITIKINKPLIHFFKRRFPCRRRPRFLRSLIVTRLLRQSFMFVNYYAFFVEYVADEVLTYEEVALLQPDPQRKRPVVLIGMLAQTASLKRSPFCPPSLVHSSCYDAVTGYLFPIIHRTFFTPILDFLSDKKIVQFCGQNLLKCTF